MSLLSKMNHLESPQVSLFPLYPGERSVISNHITLYLRQDLRQGAFWKELMKNENITSEWTLYFVFSKVYVWSVLISKAYSSHARMTNTACLKT